MEARKQEHTSVGSLCVRVLMERSSVFLISMLIFRGTHFLW